MSPRYALGLASVTLLLVTSTSAQAQFMPGYYPPFPPGYPSLFVNPFTRAPGLNFNFTTPFYGVQVNPFNRGVYFPLQLGNAYSIPLTGFIPLNQAAYSGFAPGATYGSTSPLTYSGSNAITQEQLRLLRNAKPAGGAGGNDIEVRKNLAEQWNPGDQAAKPNAAAPKDKADEALTAPKDDDILSGKALNDLAEAIRKKSNRGMRADSPLFPRDMLVHVRFSGSPAANLLTLYQAQGEGPLAWQRNQFEEYRLDLDKMLDPVLDALLAGTPAPAGSVDRLTAALRKVRADVEPTLGKIPPADATAIREYLDRLNLVVQAGRDPSKYAGLFQPKWATIGASASDLLTMMQQFQVKFAPATADDAEAYYAVHRALSTYYLAMAVPKK